MFTLTIVNSHRTTVCSKKCCLKKITGHNNEKDLDSLNLFCKTLGKNELN